jgi:aminomethyltransferase
MNDEDTRDGEELKKTPLDALHRELGAKMVPFAGYEMPIHYKAGILKEHNHCRSAAALFDVSHMGQLRIAGEDAARALESLVPVDVLGLKPGRQRYAFFTNDRGGILDDLMITNAGDHLFVVVNAACKAQDVAHLKSGLGSDVRMAELDDRALLALQGPAAADVLSRLSPERATQAFMSAAPCDLLGADCFVSRSGYSGEDGFEISVPAEAAEELARWLLAAEEVAPVGLGARDSLRLEAGLCLYGHDLDDTTTPVEAALEWALSKARKPGGARAGGYPGADVVFEQLENGAQRRRVGLKPDGRAPVREGAAILDGAERQIGKVTSGGYGPTAGGPVAMGYVPREHAEAGQRLFAEVRGKALPMQVVDLPFVPQKYYRP